jgi:hypothetical protein
MTTPESAPPPPPGPGVTPPFPAPPIEGRTARLWVRLGVAGAAVALCCGGGLAAGIGLVVTGARAINEQAKVVVESYLNDVRAARYDDAYDHLCDALQERETPKEFATRVSDEPKIDEFRVGNVELSQIALPVDVVYRDGRQRTLRFQMSQDQSSGELEVCRIEQVA